MQKLIITAALTGGLPMRTHSPYIPYTPEEIAEEARGCHEAGASIVHIHARNPRTGVASTDPRLYQRIDRLIRDKCGVIINHSTAAAIEVSHNKRLACVTGAEPEMASLNMGAVHAAFYDAKKSEFQCVYLPASIEDIHYYYRTMRKRNVKPEFELYDQGMISLLKIMLDAKVIETPIHCQFVMGFHGQGVSATVRNLINMVDNFQESLPSDSTWSVCAVGKHEFPIVTSAIILGGHVRVGLEDNLYLEEGVLAKSNAELVARTAKIARDLGREIATPNEARTMLNIKPHL